MSTERKTQETINFEEARLQCTLTTLLAYRGQRES